MIDSKKLARIRRRVVGGYLHGLGIEPSKREYLAKVGPQLRYVSFGRGYSKNFDVSIALHFDFLPPFALAVWPGAPVPAEMCSELCAFQRLVRSHSGSQYYEYGETEAAAAEMLGDIAVSPQFWLNLQSAYDLRVAESLSGSEVRKLPTRAKSAA